MPNGRTPPLCVYLCCTPATYLVMYSMLTGSSTVSLWLWASRRALSMRMRASALRPAKARQTWSSTRPILEGVMRVSCSFMADFFSQPSTTISEPLTATAQVPRLTASRAYSTWKTWPSGEKTGGGLVGVEGVESMMYVTPYQTMRDRSRTWWAVGARWLSGRRGCVGPRCTVVDKDVSSGRREVVQRLFAMSGGGVD